jgi:hypothetical protein
MDGKTEGRRKKRGDGREVTEEERRWKQVINTDILHIHIYILYIYYI